MCEGVGDQDTDAVGIELGMILKLAGCSFVYRKRPRKPRPLCILVNKFGTYPGGFTELI